MIFSVIQLCRAFALAYFGGSLLGGDQPANQSTDAANDNPPAQTQPEPKPGKVPADREAEPEAADEPADPDNIALDDLELDALLDQLERSADDLESFTARITYRKYDALLGRTESRTGNVIYLAEPVPGTDVAIRRFALLFDALVVGSRRTERTKHYVFDGRWLAEIDEKNQQFQMREIVPPGRVLDPLKLGEGPFPLPIGQAKREVLKRFIVDWADEPTGLLGGLENVVAISLLPRSGTEEARQFTRVEVYYDRDTMLPVGVDSIESNDDRKTVLLRDVRRNPKLDADTLAKVQITRPSEDDGWVVIVEPWQGE